MSKYETTSQMISEALTGTIDKDIAIARIACRTAAKEIMFCPDCGNIMDESRTVVAHWEQRIKDNQYASGRHVACCTACWGRIFGSAMKTLDRADNATLVVETWSGIQRFESRGSKNAN